MKRITAFFITIILLLTVCGCKRQMEDDPALPDTVITAPSDEAAAAQPDNSVPPSLTGLGTIFPDDSQKNSSSNYPKDEFTQYDPDKIQISSYQTMSNTGCYGSLKAEYTYTDLMNYIGKDGLIAAGYATGMREQNSSSYNGYTKTTFIITDVYYGNLSDKKISIYEPYYLERNENNAITFCGRSKILKNNVNVLIFLTNTKNRYQTITTFEAIPLTPDYRNYNDHYLESVLNFYRGDRSEYLQEFTITRTFTYVYDNDETKDKTVTSKVKATNFWPKRDISDEDLIAEMSENVLLRLATDYKIAIWPYGHKNNPTMIPSDTLKRYSLPTEQ